MTKLVAMVVATGTVTAMFWVVSPPFPAEHRPDNEVRNFVTVEIGHAVDASISVLDDLRPWTPSRVTTTVIFDEIYLDVHDHPLTTSSARRVADPNVVVLYPAENMTVGDLIAAHGELLARAPTGSRVLVALNEDPVVR